VFGKCAFETKPVVYPVKKLLCTSINLFGRSGQELGGLGKKYA
jgi:hypothetical protein